MIQYCILFTPGSRLSMNTVDSFYFEPPLLESFCNSNWIDGPLSLKTLQKILHNSNPSLIQRKFNPLKIELERVNWSTESRFFKIPSFLYFKKAPLQCNLPRGYYACRPTEVFRWGPMDPTYVGLIFWKIFPKLD